MSEAKVKNRNAAPIQITAEQLLREAQERADVVKKAPVADIRDEAELADSQFRQRRQFEESLRMNKLNFRTWVRYAMWEDQQKQFERARSVFERALAVDYRTQELWMRYSEMEMKNKFVNHARNVFDRAITYLPRVDQFWYKYSYMEEMLGNFAAARQVFERWMEWEPNEQAWSLYIKFEKRHKEWDRVRDIYKRLIALHPQTPNWLKWTRFEEDHLEHDNAREIYQMAIDTLGPEHTDQQMYIAFVRFETRLKEFERARLIYQFALDRLPKDQTDKLYQQYVLFEKQYGKRNEMEDVLLQKRRNQYEDEVQANPLNYDSWFDFARLEESSVVNVYSGKNISAEVGRVRNVYERALTNIPPIEQKKYWRRYIYLWIKYALFEELTTKDYDRVRQIFTECLKSIPHKKFTFAKLWLMYAQFEIRRMNLPAARKTLGRAIGMCPKDKLFKGYIEIELQLREFDRCRKLYEQFIKYSPSNAYAWIKYAELETLLGDDDRARAIFELAVKQSLLDMPEVLWKAYIDYEYEEQEWDHVRSLYRRLLSRTNHPKVWSSFAEFEYRIALVQHEASEDSVSREEKMADGYLRARGVFDEGYKVLKEQHLREERRSLLEIWIDFEKTRYESFTELDIMEIEDIRDALAAKLPQQVKKRRRVVNPDDAEDHTIEEYIDYVFPEDEEEVQKKKGVGIAKLLAKAREWKQQNE